MDVKEHLFLLLICLCLTWIMNNEVEHLFLGVGAIYALPLFLFKYQRLAIFSIKDQTVSAFGSVSNYWTLLLWPQTQYVNEWMTVTVFQWNFLYKNRDWAGFVLWLKVCSDLWDFWIWDPFVYSEYEYFFWMCGKYFPLACEMAFYLVYPGFDEQDSYYSDFFLKSE